MPHCVLELSANVVEQVEAEAFFGKLHPLLAETGSVALQNLKGRIIRQQCFYIGDGGNSRAYVFFQLSLLSGRSIEERRSLAEIILQHLQAAFRRSIAELDCSVTVEVREMERATHLRLGDVP